MRQEIYDDPFDIKDWDTENMSRCFVHITNSLVWRAITDEMPPTIPLTASEYNKNGLQQGTFECSHDRKGVCY